MKIFNRLIKRSKTSNEKREFLKKMKLEIEQGKPSVLISYDSRTLTVNILHFDLTRTGAFDLLTRGAVPILHQMIYDPKTFPSVNKSRNDILMNARIIHLN